VAGGWEVLHNEDLHQKLLGWSRQGNWDGRCM